MGRKPVDGVTRNIMVSCKISEDEMKRINKLVEGLDIPKMTLVRNLILDSCEDMEKLDYSSLKGIKKTSEFLKKFKKLKIFRYEDEKSR